MQTWIQIPALLLFAATASAQTPAEPDSAAVIKQMVGCFQVRFNFVEDGTHDAIFPPVYERADLASDRPLTIKRTLILGTQEQPHWSEVWTPAEGDQWQQEVTGPYGDFRYRCTAAWNVNQWSCATKSAAKPRRDADRPYATLDRLNTLQLNSKRWVQMEQNRKLTASGDLYSVEVGWNQYERVEPKLCTVAAANLED